MSNMHVIASLSFWLSLFALACAQRTPTISFISQEQIKDIGGVVELDCSVQYAQDYPVVWMKVNALGETLPVSTSSTLIVRDSRFALRYDKASSTYTLQIKDIQETDAGKYMCQVIIAINNKINAEVELFVRRPPVISDNSTRSRIVSEGQEVILECYAGGYPVPRISWRRENSAILPTGGSVYRGNVLKISSIRKEDRGTYYCVAENGVGKGTRRNIAVEVEFAPVITVPRPRLGQALQYDMDLECHVEAYPPPAIVWLKDDIQLANNQHYSISHFATADEFTDTTLRVITVEKRQYGTYTCKASNKLGSAQSQVELFESIIPVCPPACVQPRYGDAAQLSHSTVALLLMPLVNYLLRSELWDVEDANFRDRSVKRDSWEAVGKEFNITGEEAQNKFKNLRTYAQTERKKCGKSGSAASRRKPWFAFEAIKFVLARDIPNPGVSSESVGSASDINQEETDKEYELNQTSENPRGPNPQVRKKKTNSLDDETINAAKMVLVDATIRTPATAFGEYVAQKLAGYDPRIRSDVEMKIMQVLHEADMQTFQRPSQVLPSTSFQWESSASYEGVESDTTDSLSLHSEC